VPEDGRRAFGILSSLAEHLPYPSSFAIAILVLASAVVFHGRALDAAGRRRLQAESAEGQSTFERMCTRCHDASRISQTRRTRDQWDDILDKMASQGASGTDEDWDVVEAYLLRNFGDAKVNVAPAEDLALVLGLSDETSAAVVKYRSEHGPFENFDALCKVPGIDPAALSSKRDAIDFGTN
jgi:hypothetical protein